MEKTLIDISKIENPLERLNHYLARGFAKEALKDENYVIRREYYRLLGYTKEALKDKTFIIRQEAEEIFKIQAKYRSK